MVKETPKRTIKSPHKPRPTSLRRIKETVKKVRNEYKDWTKYHIIYTLRHQWKFYREGAKRSIVTNKDRNKVIHEALYQMCNEGGYLVVHYKDGSVDFIVNNWCG